LPSSVPPRLGVLGGGVVGVEMAQAFATLGSEVHLVISGPLWSADRLATTVNLLSGRYDHLLAAAWKR